MNVTEKLYKCKGGTKMVKLDKKQMLIVIGIGVLIFSVIAYYFYTIISKKDYEQLEVISEDIVEENNKIVENDAEEIVIHIAGEVKKPGIIRVKEGARIADIIEEAGGLKEEADITKINLAYWVEDGQKIIIPKKGEEIEEYITDKSGSPQQQEETKNNIGGNKTININKASIEDLQNLPGIGEQTAQKIIEYRKANGEFKQPQDIKNVSGIGDAKYEKIKEQIRIK